MRITPTHASKDILSAPYFNICAYEPELAFKLVFMDFD